VDTRLLAYGTFKTLLTLREIVFLEWGNSFGQQPHG